MAEKWIEQEKGLSKEKPEMFPSKCHVVSMLTYIFTVLVRKFIF